ncbi:phage portal protein [Brevibacterium linens]|uniref:phage portal protein n=1 Tax=Brevibacterium linens TaxID=1703 RepID=UPI003BF5CCE1
MAAPATATILSDEEKAVFAELRNEHEKHRSVMIKMDRYYEGVQRLEHIGLAVPPELRRFETVVNLPRIAVDEVERRLDVKSLMLPDDQIANEDLRVGWEYNDLDAQAPQAHKEAMIFGRSFVTVGSNEEDPDQPLMTVESPRHMSVKIDNRRRQMTAALRQYIDPERKTDSATLYLPNTTIWLTRNNGSRWDVTDRDDHNIGRVPVVMFLNRQRTGSWFGTSEMHDVLPLTDAIARSLTNLQIAAETHSVPQKYVLGMTKGDFVDKNGDPIPVWESYFSGIWAHANKDAKVGQFSPSDLKNFHDTVNHYMALAAAITGLPVRYMGQQSVNPAAEGAIRADEARLVKNTERKQVSFGASWGWSMSLRERFRTGEFPRNGRIRLEWYDAGTPTMAQRSDSIQKLSGGTPILSREGAWDELGWSEARKARERQYFIAQESDPYFQRIQEKEELNDPSILRDPVQEPDHA